jgi:sugar O-acyltransferase (sialic acid O-acetyltransferase NeuD family)
MKADDQVILIGYSGHAFVAADIFERNQTVLAGYCDVQEKELNPYGLAYLGTEANYLKANKIQQSFFVAIGNNAIRRRVSDEIIRNGGRLINAIHPNAMISSKVELGTGVLVAASATINPMSIIEDGVICNTSSSVDHDCIIGAYSHIAPGAVLCGNVQVGRNCFIGARAVVKEGVTICDDVIIGAGAVVITNIDIPGTYVGCPAAPKK